MNVAWKREAGALREAQLAKPSGDLNGKEYATVVDSVYAKRGAAPSIRIEVEAECVAQKQQEADEAAALAALSRKFGAADKTPVSEVSQGGVPMNSNAREDAAKVRKNADKKVSCSNLNERLMSVKNSARLGGNVGTMERLSNETREIERKMSSENC